MSENYAELTLYYGICSSEGCSEGKFKLVDRNSNKYAKHRFFKAMKRVTDAIDQNYEWCDFQMCWKPFVKNQEEARRLIEFASKNIFNVHGLVELVDCMHGTIKFCRKIRFNGWTKEQKEELIEKLGQNLTVDQVSLLKEQTLCEYLKFYPTND